MIDHACCDDHRPVMTHSPSRGLAYSANWQNPICHNPTHKQ